MLNFSQYTIQSYGEFQDWYGVASIQDSGQTLSIRGNGWKKIDFAYDITAQTVLEFEFKSTKPGEVHGIGFDTDNRISPDRTFQLYGSENWGINQFRTYASRAGEWVRYQIPVGQFYTGSMQYLTFTNDHDVWFPSAESLFRNLRVFEKPPEDTPPPPRDLPTPPLNLSRYPITSYAGQDLGPSAVLSGGGSTVQLQGNNWKKLAFPYGVTADTVLEFEFRSDREGEIHGIGFDTDDILSADRTFKLHGTQDWGIRNFDTYGDTGNSGQWQAYKIRVGDFFKGSMSYLMLVNDHDVRNPNAESFFRNIRVYEAPLSPPPPVIFEAGTLNGIKSFSNALLGAGPGQPDHIYRFSVNQTSDFNLILEGLRANADVTLSRMDSSGNRTAIATGSNPGNQAELLYQTLLPGDYTLQLKTVAATDYDLILSAVPDVAGTSQQLAVSTATYLGGLGNDTAVAVEISPSNELIIAGNFSASLGSAQTLLGANATSRGQIARLSASGREILSVTHLGNEINDMDVNRVNGQIVVGGDFGVTVLNATGDRVLWSQNLGGAVDRVAIANDGTVVTLQGKTVTTWNSSGQKISQATQVRSYVNDVAINPETNLVYVTGFDNKRNVFDNNNPVQVAFLTAVNSNNLSNFQWQNWGFDGNTLTSNGQNDMADTRGYRLSVGRDGLLYFLGEVAGGNSIFRWNGRDRTTSTLVKYDAFNDPYNSKSPHQAYYARLNPTTGQLLQGQLAFARLGGEAGGATNAFRVNEGAIAADESGNIYISGQGFSKIQNRDLNQINGQTVGAYAKGELTALVVASDFQSRRLWTPFTEDVGRGVLQGIAVGQGRAAVLGSVSQGTVITTAEGLNPEPFNLNPVTTDDTGSLRDVYLATWGTDSLSAFVSLQAGTAAADVLSGGRSADLFVGGGGGDRLTGGGGADAFRYDAPSDGGDTITDFGADDQILISAQGFGSGLVAGTAASLVLGNTPVGNGPNFLYAQGVLRFDGDGLGSGGAVAIATFSNGFSLTASQISLVA